MIEILKNWQMFWGMYDVLKIKCEIKGRLASGRAYKKGIDTNDKYWNYELS